SIPFQPREDLPKLRVHLRETHSGFLLKCLNGRSKRADRIDRLNVRCTGHDRTPDLRHSES
ncbi:MAG: hypothetical protein ACK55Z_03045, partial [bacterium]